MKNKSISLSENDCKLILTLCLLIIFGNINITMFNLAIPAISLSFSLSSSEASWIMVGYSIMMAIGAGTYSKLTDSFSFRRLYVIGLLIFAAGSIIGFFASSFTQLIIGRIIQAAGASSISPLSYGIATSFFDYNIRGRVLGILSATIAFASGLGPVFGGFIEEYTGWHTLFLVSSLCLFLLPFILKYMPDTEHHQEYFDVKGMLFFSGGMALIMVGVTVNFLLGFIGLILIWGFWIHDHKAKHPFISVNLLKNTSYCKLLGIALITFLCNTGLTFLLPTVMENVFNMSMGTVGMLMIPGALFAALLGPAIGKWSDKYGSFRILIISQGIVIFGFFLLSISIRWLPLVIALLIIIPVVGFNGVLTASGKSISLTVNHSELGIGMGLYTLFYLLGGAFGPALIGRLLDFKVDFGAIYIILGIIGVVSFLLALSLRGISSKAL
ncbi:MFS transporter [Clostridium neuense]|uniref:MFS transporter n=1 Tax=Clostridium neuense TaxID=1728934 RepID=A0ABW8TAQ8_9CLOT